LHDQDRKTTLSFFFLKYFSVRYLATTNLLRNHDKDHVARMAQFAIDTVAAAQVLQANRKILSKLY
jgi:hypothetical protein